MAIRNALGLPIALKLGIVFWKTILRVKYFDILMYLHGVSGVTAYKLDHSLRKVKLAGDCFHIRIESSAGMMLRVLNLKPLLGS